MNHYRMPTFFLRVRGGVESADEMPPLEALRTFADPGVSKGPSPVSAPTA